MDEELKTASVIQRRLLPAPPTGVSGYTFAGMNRPCRTVSGDYYDFVVRPDGRVYFVIADVSGKGVTAGLLMAGLQASFRIFTKNDPRPAELMMQLNVTLKENLPQSKFVTLFLGRLDTRRSLLAGVERSPRNSVTRVDPDGTISTRRYWDPGALLETAKLSPEDVLERLEELLVQAVERSVSGNDVVSLSGGIDSPTIAALAAARHRELSGKSIRALSCRRQLQGEL